jgi:hypothetical protein
MEAEEGAPFKVTRLPQRHFPEVLARVTRASSIGCLVSDGGKMVADSEAQNPLLAAPHNHG